jgi:hypothetical protein
MAAVARSGRTHSAIRPASITGFRLALAKGSVFLSAVTLGCRDGGDGQTVTQHDDAAGPFV